MTDPDDPPRLSESLDAPAGLRAALQRARADVGTADEVARLAGKLGPLLGPAPVAPGAAGGGAAAGGAAAKVGLGALALIVAGGAAWLLSTRDASLPPKVASSAAAPAPAPAPVAAPAPSAVVTSPPLVVAPPSAELPSPSPPKATPVTPPSEADLLEQARAALKAGDSARALQRASEHAKRYPRGVLVQEREVLAIQALRRLGRDAEADRRADAFARAYPGSAFQRKLQR
jgi:TolA-binding protein